MARIGRFLAAVYRGIHAVLVFLVLLPVYVYQRTLSKVPGIGSACRFRPTCSHFMVQAVKQKGILWGVTLGVYRILRCNPFNPHFGWDPPDHWSPYWDGIAGRWTWQRPADWPALPPYPRPGEPDPRALRALQEGSDADAVEGPPDSTVPGSVEPPP